MIQVPFLLAKLSEKSCRCFLKSSSQPTPLCIAPCEAESLRRHPLGTSGEPHSCLAWLPALRHSWYTAWRTHHHPLHDQDAFPLHLPDELLDPRGLFDDKCNHPAGGCTHD